jgi:hypothetical protein
MVIVLAMIVKAMIVVMAKTIPAMPSYMAFVTSLISGPLTQALMKSKIGSEQETG